MIDLEEAETGADKLSAHVMGSAWPCNAGCAEESSGCTLQFDFLFSCGSVIRTFHIYWLFKFLFL